MGRQGREAFINQSFGLATEAQQRIGVGILRDLFDKRTEVSGRLSKKPGNEGRSRNAHALGEVAEILRKIVRERKRSAVSHGGNSNVIRYELSLVVSA